MSEMTTPMRIGAKSGNGESSGEMMRKRGAKRRHIDPRAGILMPHQTQNLLTPIHMAIELLPLGLFTEDHGHDLAAFLNVISIASTNAGDSTAHKAAQLAAAVLLKMKNRAMEGKAWNVTFDERNALMESIVTCDKFMRRQPHSRVRAAILKTYQWCAEAASRGLEEMDLIEAKVRI